jgi:hypothetical protein
VLSDGLYFAFTSFPSHCVVYINLERAKIVCGHPLSRLALGVTQQGQTGQVSYYMKVGQEWAVGTKVLDRSSTVISSY